MRGLGSHFMCNRMPLLKLPVAVRSGGESARISSLHSSIPCSTRVHETLRLFKFVCREVQSVWLVVGGNDRTLKTDYIWGGIIHLHW